MRLDPVTKSLQREGIPTVLGPLDKRALEEGLRIKEVQGGKVAVLSMAPLSARDALLEALAMGADEAFLLSDRAFAGSDTWSTSLTLSKGVQKRGPFDLILCGGWSLDGSTGQVGAQLAEFLGIGNVAGVVAVESITGGILRTKSRVESGYRIVETPLPALLSVNREINTPRFTSLFGVMDAESKALVVWSADDLGLSAEDVGFRGSPTQTGDLFVPDIRRRAEILTGAPEEMVEKILHEIRRAIGS